MLLLYVCSNYAKERIIERPPFISWSSTSIEIEKIVLTDTATVFHIQAFYQPNYWIQISPDSYLKADNGEKYYIKTGVGITLGKNFWMPKSGEASFQLIFPPLPESVKTIDFIESDCDNCFKIWGIALNGKLPEIDFAKETKSQFTPSKSNDGKAIVSGKILEYQPQSGAFTIGYTNVLNNDFSQIPLNINPDGTFRIELDIPCPQIISVLNANISFCVAPGEETNIIINLREIFRSQSKLRKGEKAEGKKAYFNGYMADVNTQFTEHPIKVFMLGGDFEKIIEKLDGKDIGQYKEYFLNKYKGIITQADKLPKDYKKLIIANANIELAAILFQVPSLMKRVHIINHIKDRDESDKYYSETKIEVPEDFYDYLKDKSFNNPDLYFTKDLGYNLFLFGEAFPSSKDILSKLFQSEKGVYFDLLAASKIGRQIKDFSPITKEDREQMKTITDPRLIQSLENMNEALLKKLEENKKKTGYTINETGDAKNEDLLNSIISKYKGKVILIDFWATWCGPCRMAMKEMQPMKEDLKDKDITYIYLTGETSPLPTWKNMIPDIHGEHFRVTNEQWDYFYKALKIEGVPTYFIIDKNGNIAYRTTGFPGADAMKGKLLEVLNK